MKTVAVVQARMGSSRLPGKVMRQIGGRTLIDILTARLSASLLVDEIVIATGEGADNLDLVAHGHELGFRVVRGSESDVLSRFALAAREADAQIVVRITGDCPLVDPSLVDLAISEFRDSGVDYVTNAVPATFPDGLDVEVFSREALEIANAEAVTAFDREHVTPYLRTERFRQKALIHDVDLSDLRWTVDESIDFEVVTSVFERLGPGIHFSWSDVVELWRREPGIFEGNRHLVRNEGAAMSDGQKLWKRAKQVIPGGNMLLSKRAEMFLPDQWPAYFSRSSGSTVWDLDGNAYQDMSLMGVGTNTLGYGHPEVDDAVRSVIDRGNMSTLNAPEEVLLAERLVELHPWSDMVRFARSGGEANAIAIRIARAASGREKVAICGYHGWHDWYLSTNLGDDENLSEHLLPGLNPAGVPSSLRGTVLPFRHNDFEGLQALVADHDIGVIKMEVQRSSPPADGFLEKVRQLATEKNIVLIFDECTSGFRESLGGIHKNYGVEPDMAVFGKTLGNGYAVTATIGRREIMEAAQSTFISSTFWTERIGSAAALKTLAVMEEVRSWEIITGIGEQVRTRWQGLADDRGLSIHHAGIASLAGYAFDSPHATAYKTLITQEMLKRGFLASTSFYSSIAHSPDVIDRYFDNLAPVFDLIRSCEDGQNVLDLLDGPVAHDGFRRLN